MKTIRDSSGDILRVSNEEATKLCEEVGCAEYVPKSAWKAIRDADKVNIIGCD